MQTYSNEMHRTMPTRTRVRQYGMAGLVGGVLLALYTIPDLIDPETFSGTGPMPPGSVRWVYGAFTIVLLVLMLLGLLGLHARLRLETGRLERIGYYVSLLGFVAAILAELYGYGLVETGFDPFDIGDIYFIVFILGLFILIVGSALIGAAGLRAGVGPRVGFALFVLSVLGIPLVFVLSDTAIGTPFVAIALPYGAAWTVVGYHLWSEPEPARVGTPTQV